MQKSRRSYIRALIFLTVSLLMLICYMSAWSLLTGSIKKKEAIRFNRNFASLCEAVTDLRVSMDALSSAQTLTAAQNAASEGRISAGSAEDALLSLDEDRKTLLGLLDYMSLCRSFCQYCADQYALFDTIPDEDAESLKLLYDYVVEAERLLRQIENEAAAREDAVVNLSELTVSHQLSALFDDLPLLVFDHTSSRRVQSGDSSFTMKALPLTRREAEKKAQEILGSEISLSYGENKLSSVEVYSFYCDNALVDISKNGGYPIRILRDITSSGKSLEASVLLTRMSEYLNRLGYGGLTVLSSELADGTFTAVFVYTEGNLTDYTSCVKISCLADTARVVYLDAADYAANRGSFAQPVLPSNTAVFLLFDGSGEPHYCVFAEGCYYDIETGAVLHAPVLPE